MKCNPERTLDNQHLEKIRQDEQREQEYINSLPDEEREKYLQQKKEKQKASLKIVSQMLGIASALGINPKY